MAKTQMQLANKAWRNVTKSYGWDRGWKGGKKAWKAFCRENAAATIEMDDDPIPNYAEAEWRVNEELSHWD